MTTSSEDDSAEPLDSAARCAAAQEAVHGPLTRTVKAAAAEGRFGSHEVAAAAARSMVRRAVSSLGAARLRQLLATLDDSNRTGAAGAYRMGSLRSRRGRTVFNDDQGFSRHGTKRGNTLSAERSAAGKSLVSAAGDRRLGSATTDVLLRDGTGGAGRTVRVVIVGNSFPLGHKCDLYESPNNYIGNASTVPFRHISQHGDHLFCSYPARFALWLQQTFPGATLDVVSFAGGGFRCPPPPPPFFPPSSSNLLSSRLVRGIRSQMPKPGTLLRTRIVRDMGSETHRA